MEDYKHIDVTEKIIKAFYIVYNTLGSGFLEKVYVKALIMELEKAGLLVKEECPIQVYYTGKVVGEFFADLIVQDCIIVEVKAAKALASEHEAQLLNYLKATRIEVGLLLNFGPKPEVKRMVFANSRK